MKPCSNSTRHDVPGEILGALTRRAATLQYSSVKSVYYVVWLTGNEFCGVFGDGDNGCYEWFTWCDGKLKTSDCGYGSPSIALRDVLNIVEPLTEAK